MLLTLGFSLELDSGYTSLARISLIPICFSYDMLLNGAQFDLLKVSNVNFQTLFIYLFIQMCS